MSSDYKQQPAQSKQEQAASERKVFDRPDEDSSMVVRNPAPHASPSSKPSYARTFVAKR